MLNRFYRATTSIVYPVVSGQGSGPGQNLLFAGPNKACNEQEQEDEHVDGLSCSEPTKGNREWQEKNSFDVEDQKDDRVEVVTGLEFDPGIARGFEPTLIDGVLAGAGFLGRVLPGPDPSQRQGTDGETGASDQQHENR